METKKCNKCQQVLPVSMFGKESRAKNGYKPRCKECTNAYYREFYKEKYSKKKIDQVKTYFLKNSERIKEKKREYAESNKEYQKEYQKKYRKKNHKKIIKNNNKYIKNKRKSDPLFKCLLFMRKQIERCLVNKTDTTKKLLGYTKKDLLNKLGGHIPQGYHIDHKVPITWFDKSTPACIINSLENLQLIPADQNIKKGNRYADKITKQYYEDCISYIQNKYKPKITHT